MMAAAYPTYEPTKRKKEMSMTTDGRQQARENREYWLRRADLAEKEPKQNPIPLCPIGLGRK